MYEQHLYGDGHRSRGQSGMGIASLLISLTGAAVMFAAVGWAAYVEINQPGHFDAQADDAPEVMMMGLVVLASIGAELLALGLGIAALMQPARSKATAIVGVVFSAVTLVMLAGLMVLGTIAD
jgi:hypothetical protein